MRRLVLLALILFTGPTLAQELPLEIKGDGVQTVKIDRVIVVKEDVLAATKFPFSFRAPADALAFRWTIPAGVAYTLNDGEDTATITAAPGGTLTVSVVAKVVDWDGKKILAKKYVGKLLIPGPTPDPKPDPKPDPEPTPSPIALPGLRVLFIYETSEVTAAQAQIISSVPIRSYLKERAAKEDGQPEARFLDKDEVVKAPKRWADAAARPRTTLPWLIISNHPNGGYEGPWPSTAAETLKLLKQFGG